MKKKHKVDNAYYNDTERRREVALKAQGKRYETYRRQFQEKLDLKYGEGAFTLLTEIYKGNAQTYDFKHSCGLEFSSRADSLLRGYTRCNCPLERK